MSNKQNTKTITTTVSKPANNQSKAKASGKKKKNRNNNQNGRGFSGPTTKAAISTTRTLYSSAPKQSSLANGGILIDHTEMIGVVFKPSNDGAFSDSGSALTQIFRLRLNPGSKKTFNWLSSLAPNYEFFKFRKCEIHYEPRCSTTESASVIMSPDYDAADGQVAVSEQSLFSNKGTVDLSAWKPSVLRLNVGAMNRLYKSHPNMSDERYATTTQDQKTIDPAQVFVLVDADISTPKKYGKIFIKYTVELTDPQNPTEPANLGGFKIQSNNFLNNSTKPIQTEIQEIKIDSNLMTPLYDLPNVPLPSATLGRFARDFTGPITSILTGTGIASYPSLYVGSDPNTAAGGIGDIVQASAGAVTASGGVQAIVQRYVNAKVGDYLKMNTPNATTLTNVLMYAGGAATGL